MAYTQRQNIHPDDAAWIPRGFIGSGFRFTVQYDHDGSRVYDALTFDDIPERHKAAVAMLMAAVNDDGFAKIDGVGDMYNLNDQLGPSIYLENW